MYRTFVLAVAVLCLSVACCANTYFYGADLSGPNESPANASPGIGTAYITIDDVANTMRVQVTFSGLIGTTTASHIHCCTTLPGTGTAGVATTTPTFAGFPLGVTSGTYDNTLNLLSTTSYNPSFITANGGTAASAEAVLLAAIFADKTYLNVHSSFAPGGEIRGFLTPVPEPATMTLTAGGIVGLLGKLRKRKA
jgi:hypothetical protein